MIYDLNILYDSYLKSIKSSKWKTSSKMYKDHFMFNLIELQEELETQTYKTHKCNSFKIYERGKQRIITSNEVRDRVVRHALNDYYLMPLITPFLIYENGASQVGKGVDYQRELIKKHLRNYYYHYGNKGYILQIDFSKYYDNIHHDIALERLNKHLPKDVMFVLKEVMNSMSIDVSNKTNKEINDLYNGKFNSLEFKQGKSKYKLLPKSCSIGDQTSQVIGISYPIPIDNYCKIVRSQKYYGRYMDDIYIISNDKEELKDLLINITAIAKDLGIFINEKKTHISRIDRGFVFLQRHYFLTESGRVAEKITKKQLVRFKRRLKKLALKVKRNELPLDNFKMVYQSWYGSYHKCMSKLQIKHLKELYKELLDNISL